MYVFDTCAAFLRTVPLMQFSGSCPEDLDSTREDHVCDEWRYACMSRPVTPIRRTEDANFAINPLARRQAQH
jgi:hypothetical protein